MSYPPPQQMLPQQQAGQQVVTVIQGGPPQRYCGPISLLIGIFFFPCICFCPVDELPPEPVYIQGTAGGNVIVDADGYTVQRVVQVPYPQGGIQQQGQMQYAQSGMAQPVMAQPVVAQAVVAQPVVAQAVAPPALPYPSATAAASADPIKRF